LPHDQEELVMKWLIYFGDRRSDRLWGDCGG